RKFRTVVRKVCTVVRKFRTVVRKFCTVVRKFRTVVRKFCTVVREFRTVVRKFRTVVRKFCMGGSGGVADGNWGEADGEKRAVRNQSPFMA
ncbi:MAG: hypothetical protein LBL31_00730, partial [Spirochaetaceae bacterium]|nr:hypothetical protein [Spirochaetaceae bacterium]